MRFKRFGLGIAKGMALTLRHLWRRPITVQYPEERLHTSRRIRGNEFVWDAVRCTGCATCAKACPQGNIRIVTSKNPDNTFTVEQFEIDTGRSMFCGLCVEACPFGALFFGRDYERASYRRSSLVAHRDEVTAPGRVKSGYAHAELEAEAPRQTLLLYEHRGEG